MSSLVIHHRNKYIKGLTPEQRILKKAFRCTAIVDLSGFGQESLFHLFRRHRILLLLANRSDRMPKDAFLNLWKKASQEYSFKSLKLAGILEELIDQISKTAIKVIAIKGPILSLSLFGDIGKRHFGDLDLVVQKEDVHQVVAILEGMGYKMMSPKPGLTEKQWDYYFKYKKDVGLVNREKGVFIELHVGVYRHELLREADEGIMWENLEEVMIGGTPIKTMDKDNTFLFLLYHGGQHLYFRLFWLRDVAEALKRWELNHNEILEKAKFLGIERMVGMGLLVANEFFGIDIPKEYDNFIIENQKILGKLKRMCVKRILGPEKDNLAMRLNRHRFNLMLKPGFKYKWAVFASIFHRWYIRKFLGGH